MYCSKCGTKNNDDAKFCRNCGAPLAKKAIESYTQAVELALEGDERGFSYLYDETYKSKYYLALKYMDDKDAAEDVLQDSYIKAFSKLDSLKKPETFPSWLGTIVANTAKNALQKKNPVLFTDLPSGDEDTDLPDFDVEDESVESQPEAAYTQQETKELVNEMISSLSEEQKMCILMYYIDGESVRDIAEALDCTESAVKSRLSYGRKNLKAKAEELQKKGYKLFTLAPIPLLLALVHKDAEAAVCEKEFLAAGRRIAEVVLKKAPQIAKTAAASQTGGTGAAAHQAGTGMAAKAAASAGTAGKGGAGTGAVVGFISSTAGKVVIFVVAVAVVTGGVVGGMHSHYVRQSEEATVEYEEVIKPEEETDVASEPNEPENEDAGIIEENVSSEIQDASQEDFAEADSDIAEAVDTADISPPSVEAVQEFLETFTGAGITLSSMLEYGNYPEGGEVDAGTAYLVAAIAAVDNYSYSDISESYYLIDGNVYSYSESSQEQRNSGPSYWMIPESLFEEYAVNLFGSDYTLDNFVDDNTGVKRDADGQFYYPVVEMYDGVVTVEDISEVPDKNGSYKVLAKYIQDMDYYDDSIDNDSAALYVQYQITPDSSSAYEFIITGISSVNR